MNPNDLDENFKFTRLQELSSPLLVMRETKTTNESQQQSNSSKDILIPQVYRQNSSKVSDSTILNRRKTFEAPSPGLFNQDRYVEDSSIYDYEKATLNNNQPKISNYKIPEYSIKTNQKSDYNLKIHSSLNSLFNFTL